MTPPRPISPLLRSADDGPLGAAMEEPVGGDATVTGAPSGRPAHPPHLPVLCDAVLAALAPRDGAVILDGTFGHGGYTEALLQAADCRVVAIDRDPAAATRARALAARYGDRLLFVPGCFGAMTALLSARGVSRLDGVTLDLGVSSMQLDQPERGFSFRADGPLDMRMDGPAGPGPSAADLVNGLDEATLADILYYLGEERAARRVAHALVEARAEAPIRRTATLAAIIRRVVRKSADGIDPATRSFQALRLAVNDELGELARGLMGAEALLAPGGRLAIVSFHSLEDRMVKTFLRDRADDAARGISRHLPPAPGSGRAGAGAADQTQPTFATPQRRALRPDEAECRANPRARSARLRVAIRTDAPARPDSPPDHPLARLAGFGPAPWSATGGAA